MAIMNGMKSIAETTSSWMALFAIGIVLLPTLQAITVPVDDIPLARSNATIQSRKFTVDNRGYAHVQQDLNAPEQFHNSYKNSTQDPRNRRIIPLMTFFIPSTGGGQFYQPKLRPAQDHLLLDQSQQSASTAAKGHPVLAQSATQQRFHANHYPQQQLAKPTLYPIVHPSIGPNGQPHSPLSLNIANNYRSQFHQPPPQQQYETLSRRPIPAAFNGPVPLRYAPPTNIPFHPLPQSPAPLQIFYGPNGRTPSSPKLNNQPYVIVSAGSAEKLHPLAGQPPQQHHHQSHQKHRHPQPPSHPQQVLQFEQANENQHHNLLTSPEAHPQYAQPAHGKGITPFLPSNQVPGNFKPMMNSQKVSHVPIEVYQQYVEQEHSQAEKYQIVSTTEKPIKYKYQLYQPQRVTTERPFYENQQYLRPSGPSSLEAENELHDEQQIYYSTLKSLNSQQAVQRPPPPPPPQLTFDENQFVVPITTPSPILHSNPSERPYVVASTTAKPRHPKPKYSSTYRAGYLSIPDSAPTSTTPAPYKSAIPSFRPLKSNTYYSPASTIAPPHSGKSSSYATTAIPPPTGQHLTETTFVNPTKISTYHPKINYAKPVPQYPATSNEEYYYYDQKQQAVATTAVPRTPRPSYNDDLALDDNQSLSQLLKKLQDSNHLPKTLTPDNIDNSIKTLIKILDNLKHSPNLAPDQHLQHPSAGGGASGGDYDDTQDYYYDKVPNDPLISDNGNQVDEQLGANSGTPGVDYPNLFEIPTTEFNCKSQRYKGFFGDPETRCQVWHYCDLNGGQASFLCPNGTIFSQVALTCDWWFNVKCDTTAQLYVLNERLYKYILPFTPKFPEDYSGPLVDKYLALKFKEMEEKMRKQKGGRVHGEDDDDVVVSEEDNDDELGGISSIDQGISKMDGDSLAQDIRGDGDGIAATTTTVRADIDTRPPLLEDVTGSNELEISKERIIQVTRPSSVTVGTPALSPQAAPLVEIKSDGNSGHLNPILRHRG